MSSATGESNAGNNTAVLTHLVNELADLILTKLCKPDDLVEPSGVANCTLFVDNLGSSGARQVVVHDVMVSNGNFVVFNIVSSQGSCALDPGPPQTIECSLGSLDAGARALVRYELASIEDVDMNNVAMVSSAPPDPDTTNNRDEDSLSFAACLPFSLQACLDEDFDPSTGLSRWVVALAGDADRGSTGDEFCGSPGYYSVASGTGRIDAQFELPDSGLYRMTFRYRVGNPGQDDESLRIAIGGSSFDFSDVDLINSNDWEESPPVEVNLGAGVQTLEFLSIGEDSVHLEEFSVEKICEAQPPRLFTDGFESGTYSAWSYTVP